VLFTSSNSTNRWPACWISRAGVRERRSRRDQLARADDPKRREIALQFYASAGPVDLGHVSRWRFPKARNRSGRLRSSANSPIFCGRHVRQRQFLLTSRREERGWLAICRCGSRCLACRSREDGDGARPGRKAEPAPHGRGDWRPLLEFTQGIRSPSPCWWASAARRCRTRQQIEAFVARLRAGEAAFTDEASEGRTKSLAASLNYGSSTPSMKPNASNCPFCTCSGFCGCGCACWMVILSGVAPRRVHGLTRRMYPTSGSCRRSGLLTAHGGGYYSIHPAVPWFFAGSRGTGYGGRDRALRAYVASWGAR